VLNENGDNQNDKITDVWLHRYINICLHNEYYCWQFDTAVCYSTNGPDTLSGNAIHLCSVWCFLAMLDGILLTHVQTVSDRNATMGEGHCFTEINVSMR